MLARIRKERDASLPLLRWSYGDGKVGYAALLAARVLPHIGAKTRRQIADFIGPGRVAIATNTLETIFALYDAFYFDGTLSRYLADAKIALAFRVANVCGVSSNLARTVTVAESGGVTGITMCVAEHFERKLNPTAFRRYFFGKRSDPISRATGLLLVFEHEFVHLLVRLFKGKLVGHHGGDYRHIVQALFAHHRMPDK